jgi:hypothetical protein
MKAINIKSPYQMEVLKDFFTNEHEYYEFCKKDSGKIADQLKELLIILTSAKEKETT